MSESNPPPMEWHPAYRDHGDLWVWLENNIPEIELPRPRRRVRARSSDADVVSLPPLRLVKRRAMTTVVPYVGRPFVYWWNYATDQYGRVIAGRVRLRYTDEVWTTPPQNW